MKVGSHVLLQRNGRPNPRRLAALVDQLARLRGRGIELVLVSSGAIGAGLEPLGLKTRPSTIPGLQMAAAVGQSRLMARYAELFAKRGLTVGQVLLTHDDLEHRARHLNARTTLLELVRHGVLPIVNENDVVAVDEIKFGDNDQLASLVTLLVEAELLIILSTVDGLLGPAKNGRSRRVPWLPAVDEAALSLIWPATRSYTGATLSVGGMSSKLTAARQAGEAGAAVVIADGRKERVLERVLDGEDIGTLIGPRAAGPGPLPSRKRWLAFFQRPCGAIVVDEGAAKALLAGGKSLLPAGIRGVEGRFGAGDVVAIKRPDGKLIARGVADYASEEVERIKGRKTSDIATILGRKDYDEVVHRDRMVLL